MKSRILQTAKMFGGFVVLLAILELSKFILSIAGLRFPPALFGMILLFVLLITGILPAKWVEGTCTFLMKNMLFFFTPLLVGIFTYGEILKGKILSMGMALLIGVIVTMAITALSLKLLNLFENGKAENVQTKQSEL